MASLSGPQDAVEALLAAADLPPRSELLGPVDEPPHDVRMLVRVPRSEGMMLAGALHLAQAARSARKAPGAVRVQLDPAELI
jgi:primosomal protein N' (replication factor Y)